MKVITDSRKVKEVLESRFIDKIYPSRAKLEEALQSRKRLTIYWGTDPTAPDLHLDHGTNLLILREFQKLGHQVIFLIGDFTVRIGDPSDRLNPRRALPEKEIAANVKNFKNQAAKILDFRSKNNPAKLKFNSQWLGKLTLLDFLKIAANFTHAQIIERDMFQRRIKEKKVINFPELIYPLLQGYDSVAMDVDIELGGTDQTFNMLVGRDLVKIYRKKEKFVITKPLLADPKTGGQLMSKSTGNYISLSAPPAEMYGKVMALPDAVITRCLELWTLYPQGEIEKIKKGLKSRKLNPRDAKIILAFEIVSLYHGKSRAKAASEEFERVFKSGELPDRIPQIKLKKKKMGIIDLLVGIGFASSKSAATRLVEQGGVRTNGDKVTNPKIIIEIPKTGIIIRAGKRKFVEAVKD